MGRIGCPLIDLRAQRAGPIARWLALMAVFAWVHAPAYAGSPSASDVDEMHLSGGAIDKALAGKKTYDFVIVSAREIVDQDGRHFSPDDVRSYIARAKPKKKAAYVFWIHDQSAVEIAKKVISAFSDYGAQVFVIRETKKTGDSGAKAADVAGIPKILSLVGLPNPGALSASDQPPDMAARPACLRPGKLPPRVRYKFEADPVVAAAADRVTRLLLGPALVDTVSAFKSALFLQPGAWRWLKNLPALAESKPILSRADMGRKVVKLEGRFIVKPEQFAAAIGEIRRLIAADGGGVVRALTSDEMEAWWTFIGFDIEEPVFVIETKGGKYRFIAHWSDDGLGLLDELNALNVQ